LNLVPAAASKPPQVLSPESELRLGRAVPGRCLRLIAGALALSLLLVFAKPHDHTSLLDREGCVACAAQVRHATPATPPQPAPPPPALFAASERGQPRALAHVAQPPLPRAQGPPDRA
jgi:hypothetical protein